METFLDTSIEHRWKLCRQLESYVGQLEGKLCPLAPNDVRVGHENSHFPTFCFPDSVARRRTSKQVVDTFTAVVPKPEAIARRASDTRTRRNTRPSPSMTSTCYSLASARVSLARARTKRRARIETATPETLRGATIVPERCARVSTRTPTDAFLPGTRARSEDSRDLRVDAFERGGDDAEGDRSVLRVEGDRRRCRRVVPETPLRNALTPLVHERVPPSRHGTDTPPEVTSPRRCTKHATTAVDGERAAGKPEKTVVGVAAACQRFLGAVDVGRVESARSRLAQKSSGDSADTGDDARRPGATNRPTRESRGRKTPIDVENATRVSFGDSDDESNDAPPSPFRRSDFAAAGARCFTSIAAALDDIDDKAGLEHEELEDLDDLQEQRGSPPPPDAFSPARVKKRRHEAAASNLDASDLSRSSFGAEFFSSAKLEPDAHLPLTLMRQASEQSLASITESGSEIELLAHRASLEQQLGEFVHRACAKRARTADDARRDTARRGDGGAIFNLNAADFQPRALDVSAGTTSQMCVPLVPPDLPRDEALEMVHHPTCPLACTGRDCLGDLFGLGQTPSDPGLAALRITDQFEADLKHALEMELAC